MEIQNFIQWNTDRETLVITPYETIKKQETPSKEIAKAKEIKYIFQYLKSEGMEEMKFYTEEEVLDKVIGEKGTSARNKYEDDINNFLIGEAIKQTGETRNLTQEQLGELMGVKRAQISKIESGKSVTFSTIIRAFKAMGVNSANLDLGSLGKVALW